MKSKKIVVQMVVGAILVCLYSCNSSTILEGAVAVTPFDKEKYLGRWYEIARLDFKYERGLNNVTAQYSLNSNGTIKVNNQGYNPAKKEWKQAIGKAKFVNNENTGMLKVSFFGPFYSGYNVIALDKEYRYALVAGESLDNLWILSRGTTITADVKENYLRIAEDIGYNTRDLVWVKHDKQN